jgi:glycine cleavage system aminomethyltransferase T
VLLENGHDRIGEQLVASAPIADQQVGVQVVSPHFFDPQGKRQYA